MMLIDPTDPVNEIIKAYNEHERKLYEKGIRLSRKTEKGIFVPSDMFMAYRRFMGYGLQNYESFADLGSGDGRIVRIASLFTSATGFEADSTLFQYSMDIGQIPDSGKFRFLNTDYMAQDLSQFDFLYWFPDDMNREFVESKLLEEMKGRLVIHRGIYTPKHLIRIPSVSEPNFFHYINPNHPPEKADKNAIPAALQDLQHRPVQDI